MASAATAERVPLVSAFADIKYPPMTGRFSIEAQAFSMALGPVAAVCPRKSPKPILQQVLLTIDPDNGSYISATDLEVGVRLQILGVRADKAGQILLNPAKLQQILRQAKGELFFEPSVGKLKLSGDKFKFDLCLDDCELYPSVPIKELMDYHELTAPDLLKGISRTRYATDIESTRYALGGLLLECDAEQIKFVGTDGRRLAQQKVPAEIGGKGAYAGEPFSSICPLKALTLLERIIDKSDPPIRLGFKGREGFYVQTYNAQIYSRLVEGRFPRYQDVFPQSTPLQFDVQAWDLRDALQLASVTTSDESRGVDCGLKPGMLVLTGSTSETGSSEIEVMVNYADSPAEVMFDPRYVIEMLATLDDETIVRVKMLDGKNAVVMTCEDSFTYVVMPLTRDH